MYDPKMTLNHWMMVERYPNLKEEVGGSIPRCEISSLLDGKTCQVINCLLCFGASMSGFCLKKKKKEKEKENTHVTPNDNSHQYKKSM
jgi:hypothetical protein